MQETRTLGGLLVLSCVLALGVRLPGTGFGRMRTVSVSGPSIKSGSGEDRPSQSRKDGDWTPDGGFILNGKEFHFGFEPELDLAPIRRAASITLGPAGGILNSLLIISTHENEISPAYITLGASAVLCPSGGMLHSLINLSIVDQKWSELKSFVISTR